MGRPGQRQLSIRTITHAECGAWEAGSMEGDCLSHSQHVDAGVTGLRREQQGLGRKGVGGGGCARWR